MDSFYEKPRTSPVPMSRNELAAVPLVPEVSMLFQNNAVVDPTPDSMYLSYNTWKNKNQSEGAGVNFGPEANKVPSPSESFMAKQVRFESPFVTKQQNLLTTRRENSKPFEDVYMANLPDRHLDLSVIEPPKMLQGDFKENTCPNINISKKYQKSVELSNKRECLKIAPVQKYAFERELHREDPLGKNKIIDMFNYKRENFEVNRPYAIRQSETTANIDKHTYDSLPYRHCKDVPKCNASIQTEINEELKTALVESTDEPTVKDLLKIIHQQNNQLLILQKQVATLLSTKDSVKQIESNPNRNFNCCTSTQVDSQQQNMCKGIPFQRKGPLQQFSVDVMTSFEVAIRRQQNVNRLTKDVVNQPPKICEVTETDSNIGNILDDIPKVNRKCDDSFKTTDVSLTFNEPVHVPQTCPSPDNTIQIDMKDYSSDSDDEDSNSEWSLYNNVRGQVNHILKKSGIQPRSNSPNINQQSTNRKSSNLKRKVKEATIKHLKSIGVHVPPIEETEDELDTCARARENQNDVSFMVKQLLMKYLPDEQLGKVTCTQSPRRNAQNDFIKRRPEFSFASVQYMQKYNLMTDLNGHQAVQNQIPLPSHREPAFERILDITAIRQQPKLL